MITSFLFLVTSVLLFLIVGMYAMRAVDEQRAVSLQRHEYKSLVRVRPPAYLSNSPHITPLIFKTGPAHISELPQEVVELFRATEVANPPYRIEYFSDDRCESFIELEYPDMLESYRSLIPGAFRADLFRYCVLHKHGGVYSDLTQQFIVSLDQLVSRKDQLVLVKDIHFTNHRCNFTGIQISFMAAQPQLPVFDIALKMVRERVTSQGYGCGMLDVTGPKLFRRALEQSQQRYRMELEQTPDGLLIFMHPGKYAGEVAVRTKLPQHDAIINKTSETSYVDLYKWRSIYKK